MAGNYFAAPAKGPTFDPSILEAAGNQVSKRGTLGVRCERYIVAPIANSERFWLRLSAVENSPVVFLFPSRRSKDPN